MASVIRRLARRIGSFFLQHLDLSLLTIFIKILLLVVAVVLYNERLSVLFGKRLFSAVWQVLLSAENHFLCESY